MTLHAGKPLLLLPEHWEQVILAWRLQQKGLALAIVRHQWAAKLRALVETLLQPGTAAPRHTAVRAFAQRVAGFAPSQATELVARALLQAAGQGVVGANAAPAAMMH